MSPRLPPGPLAENTPSFVVGLAIGLFIALELRRRGRADHWSRGIGFGLLVALVSVANLPFGLAFGAVLALAVRR